MANVEPCPWSSPAGVQQATGRLPPDVLAARSWASFCVGELFVHGQIPKPLDPQEWDRLEHAAVAGRKAIEPMLGNLLAIRSEPFRFPGVQAAHAHGTVFELATLAVVKFKRTGKATPLSREDFQELTKQLTWESGQLARLAKADSASRTQPAGTMKKKPGRKSGAENDKKIAKEYSDGLNDGLWKGQADYLRKKHPTKAREMNSAKAWLSTLLKRVENSEN